MTSSNDKPAQPGQPAEPTQPSQPGTPVEGARVGPPVAGARVGTPGTTGAGHSGDATPGDADEASRPNPGSITVTGRGSAHREADVLTLAIGIEARRASVKEAYSAGADAASAVLGVLRQRGVDGADAASSGLNVQAETSWREGAGNLVTGYLVSSTVTVRLVYRSGAEDIIAAVVSTGGDDVRLHSLEPAVSDPASGAAQARALAWADALAKAGHYAALAGRSLGQAQHIGEGEPSSGGTVPLMARTSGVAALPLQPGQSAIEATITVQWELI